MTVQCNPLLTRKNVSCFSNKISNNPIQTSRVLLSRQSDCEEFCFQSCSFTNRVEWVAEEYRFDAFFVQSGGLYHHPTSLQHLHTGSLLAASHVYGWSINMIKKRPRHVFPWGMHTHTYTRTHTWVSDSLRPVDSGKKCKEQKYALRGVVPVFYLFFPGDRLVLV